MTKHFEGHVEPDGVSAIKKDFSSFDSDAADIAQIKRGRSNSTLCHL